VLEQVPTLVHWEYQALLNSVKTLSHDVSCTGSQAKVATHKRASSEVLSTYTLQLFSLVLFGFGKIILEAAGLHAGRMASLFQLAMAQVPFPRKANAGYLRSIADLPEISRDSPPL
jgi:SPX domain protein involved in polyphosphate accumulation